MDDELPKKALAPSEVVRDHVKAIRKAKGWTHQQLADRLSQLTGESVRRDTVAKMEMKGAQRKHIGLDDVFLLAAALDAAPIDLITRRDQGRMRLAGTARKTIDADEFRAWLRGETPLGGVSKDLGFFLSQKPDHERSRDWRSVFVAELTTCLNELNAAWDDDNDDLEQRIGLIESALEKIKSELIYHRAYAEVLRGHAERGERSAAEVDTRSAAELALVTIHQAASDTAKTTKRRRKPRKES